jgi:hypothetical protein
MALQIRRGTQAELATFVPAMGEPIFTTDSKRLYVGDGQTTGGIDISIAGGLGGPLSSDINLNSNEIVGAGNINILGFIKTDGNFEGNLIGNVTGSVFANESTLLVDAENGIIPAEVVQGTFTGALSGDVISPVSSQLILDAVNSVFYGNVTGDLFGDVTGNVIGNTTGNVFAEDSTLLVDAENNILSNGSISLDGTIIRCSTSIDLRSTSSSGTAVAVSLNSSKTVQGALLSGALGIQRFDLVTYGIDKDNPQDLEAGDIFGSIGFMGIQSSTSAESVSMIGAQVDPNGTTTATHIATKFFIVTQPETETKAGLGQFPFLTFDCFGRLAVNQENAQATCDINGVMRLAPQDDEPVTPVEGMIAIADRVNWDPAGIGSGRSYPVYFDGLNWVKLS